MCSIWVIFYFNSSVLGTVSWTLNIIVSTETAISYCVILVHGEWPLPGACVVIRRVVITTVTLHGTSTIANCFSFWRYKQLYSTRELIWCCSPAVCSNLYWIFIAIKNKYVAVAWVIYKNHVFIIFTVCRLHFLQLPTMMKLENVFDLIHRHLYQSDQGRFTKYL